MATIPFGPQVVVNVLYSAHTNIRNSLQPRRPREEWCCRRGSDRMDKRDIARHVHQHAGISETQAATLLDWVLDLIKTTLQAGEPIAISGFGKFAVLRKRARPGRNPRTGEAIMITARRVVTFHPSLVLKAEVIGVPAEGQEATLRTREEALLQE